MARPIAGDYASHFERYVSLVEAGSILEAISKYSASIIDFFKNITGDKAGYRYAEGKWSLKEMLQHIIDAERIFAYRALCIARHETTSLPGFDENIYAAHSNADARNWKNLLNEFEVVRNSTNILFESFSNEQLTQSGISNNNPISVNALGFITIGHMIHHKNITAERYLGNYM